MDKLEEQANREAYYDACMEAEEQRRDPDWYLNDLVDHYDGRR